MSFEYPQRMFRLRNKEFFVKGKGADSVETNLTILSAFKIKVVSKLLILWRVQIDVFEVG